MSTLTIKEAAEQLGVSERTIRRRIAEGALRATRVPTAQGYQVYVHLDDNLDTAADKLDTVAQQSVRGHDPAMVTVVMEELARLHEENRRLQDQSIQLAGQVGFLQAQLQQAHEQIRLLTDAQHQQEPAPPTPPPEPMPQPAPQQPKRVPWWKRLFSEI